MPTSNGQKRFSNIFLLTLLIAALITCLWLLRPFLMTILIAGMLASIFWRPYQWLIKKMAGRPSWAALLMTVIVTLVIVLPFSYFVMLLSKQTVEVVGLASSTVTDPSFQQNVYDRYIQPLQFLDPDFKNIQGYLGQISAKAGGWALNFGTVIIRNATSFVVNFLILLVTLFFMFKDGRQLVERIMDLTPLSNRYDKEIFQKFRDVSYVSIISTFIIAIAQGLTGAIGFAIAGLPILVPAVLMAFTSLLPYIGPFVVWGPVAAYLAIGGEYFAGGAIVLAGLVSSVVDNALRPYLMKGKTAVHPMIILFSIFGGLMIFGFWGLLLGPLIIAITFTLLHIYELEYGPWLEK